MENGNRREANLFSWLSGCQDISICLMFETGCHVFSSAYFVLCLTRTRAAYIRLRRGGIKEAESVSSKPSFTGTNACGSKQARQTACGMARVYAWETRHYSCSQGVH